MRKRILISILFFLLFVQFSSFAISKEVVQSEVNAYTVKAKDYSYLFKSLCDFSEKQLKQHYTLYTRYVKKLNEINCALESVDKASANAAHSDYRSLKIDRAFSNNGVVLHELYFENLTPNKTAPSCCFANAITKDFGSFEKYLCDLTSSMKSTRNGWVITAYNPLTNRIENHCIEFHDLYVSMNLKPLLVADVWEHAYMIDYGIEKDAYIKAFIKNIDWQVVSKRYEELGLK